MNLLSPLNSGPIFIHAEAAMPEPQTRFLSLAAKTVVSHSLTYFLMGAFAYNVFHYAAEFSQPSSGMCPATDIVIFFGPALQVFRGILFAAVFYPFRDKLFGRKHGWLLMAWLLIGSVSSALSALQPDRLKDSSTPPRRFSPNFVAILRSAHRQFFCQRCSAAG
jgi:hypothetical protein